MSNKKRSFLNLLFSFDQIKEDYKKNKNLYKDLKEENKRKYFNETFEEAVLRLDLSEKDLIEKKKQLKKTSRFFYIISLIFLLIDITIIFNSETLTVQSYLIIPLIVIYLLLLGFRFSFNAFQIEKRDLKSLKQYFKNPKKWL